MLNVQPLSVAGAPATVVTTPFASPHARTAAGTTAEHRPRLTGIDVMRHILAVAVIFLHIHSRARYSPELNQQISVVGDYCEGAVMGFFMISGFFAKEQLEFSSTRLLRFLRASARRLLLPFFLLSLVYAVALAALGKAPLTTSLWQTATLEGSSMQLYFLPFLFYVYVAFFLYTACANQLKISAVLSLSVPLALLLIVAELYPTSAATGPDYRLLPLYAMCYIIGFYFARVRGRRPLYFYLAAATLTAVFLLGARWDKRFVDMAEVTFLFLLAVYASTLRWMGHRSLPGSGGVYLLHAPIIIYGVSTALAAGHVAGVSNVLGTLVLTYVVCLALTLAFLKVAPSRAFLLLE